MTNRYVDILKIAAAANINVSFLGRHGLGKTAITNKMKDHGFGVITKIVSLEDPALVGGIPLKVPHGDDGTFKMIYSIPDFVIEAWDIYNDGKVPLLFLDEFNRGDRFVENAFMTLVLDKKIRGHKLPPNTFIVAAMNPEADDDMGVSELTAPMMDRWSWIFFEPTVEEWLDWADAEKDGKRNVPFGVTSYIRKSVGSLDGFPMTEEMKSLYKDRIKPTRRSWDAVGRIIDVVSPDGVLDTGLLTKAAPLIAGLIGDEEALAFIEHLKDNDVRLFTTDEILNAGDAELERIKFLLENNLEDTIGASLAIAHKEIAERIGDDKEKALKILGDTSKGFGLFITNIPVDTAATFFSIENENEQFWTNLLVDKRYPEEIVDMIC